LPGSAALWGGSFTIHSIPIYYFPLSPEQGERIKVRGANVMAIVVP